MAAFENKVVLTEQARRYRAQCTVTGDFAWKVTGFTAGSKGYDPLDPTVALAPDPTATALIDQILDTKAIDSVEWINLFTPVFVCRLEQNEAVGQVGELGLWATVVTGPNTGEVFLAAILHIPVWNKTSTDARAFRIAMPS